MTLAAVVALLTALLAFLIKVWPDRKSPAEQTRENLAKNHAAAAKFEESGDTTDLGDLP